MKYEILINSVFRLPMQKALELVEDYNNNVGFKNFAEQQRVLDTLAHKSNAQQRIKSEAFQEAAFSLYFMARDKGVQSKGAFENIKGFPMIIWIEAIGYLNPKDIMSVLQNYYSELPSFLIETCIINLPEDMQLTAIDMYNKFIDKESEFFSSFYYTLSEKAKLKMKGYFPDKISEDIFLELQDLKEDELADRLLTDRDRLLKQPPDDFIKFILLNAHEITTLNRFFEIYSDKINECSDAMFRLLFTRYRYIASEHFADWCKKNGRYCYDLDDEFKPSIVDDENLFSIFKRKFHELGIEETLSLFDHKDACETNYFTVIIVLEFLDLAYSDIDLQEYATDETISKIITEFAEKCSLKDYSLEDFETLVNAIGKDGKTKLISDDYIEAIVACGKLLRGNVITDKHPLFLELREKFTHDLITRVKKDGTYLENISLDGIFYRLSKGTLPFDRVYMTRSYKGLIYLTKSGQLIDNADNVTEFLTDEQLARLNITPVIRWQNTIRKPERKTFLSFKERMGLQLLCYFGRDKGKYLLESDIPDSTMEYLFDGLKYGQISINEDGTPNINEELISFLFGNGAMKEKNTVINRMIRGETPEFKKYFTEFCNTFATVKTACNGVLSVKRIVKYFMNLKLPIELKPDEIEFNHALSEMNTTDPELLTEAIELCKDARAREYSSIPKVEGEIGNFTYKVLDLDDPLAIAVGYLSHCCFVVRGVSYSSLKHSMQSPNGRSFIVYYKGNFLAQSWIWRNGDVICFDSVEAGSPHHGMYKDDIKLVDVYKSAAQEMLYISQTTEDDIQRVKVVTIGNSDYTFNNLKPLKGNVPRPLEKNVEVYDSSHQHILAGNMPEKPRYGNVSIQYKDPRKKAVTINFMSDTSIDVDMLDEITTNINSLRYQIHKEETPIDLTNYYQVISGDGWYILFNIDGTIESGVISGKVDAANEYDKYLARYTGNSGLSSEQTFINRLKPLTSNKK